MADVVARREQQRQHRDVAVVGRQPGHHVGEQRVAQLDVGSHGRDAERPGRSLGEPASELVPAASARPVRDRDDAGRRQPHAETASR
jgi:hypothetical protein